MLCGVSGVLARSRADASPSVISYGLGSYYLPAAAVFPRRFGHNPGTTATPSPTSAASSSSARATPRGGAATPGP